MTFKIEKQQHYSVSLANSQLLWEISHVIHVILDLSCWLFLIFLAC